MNYSDSHAKTPCLPYRMFFVCRMLRNDVYVYVCMRKRKSGVVASL